MEFGGYNNRVSNVDLASGDISYETSNQEDLTKFVGGRGLGAKRLWDRRSNGRDFIGFFVGPITGTGVPLANRLTIVFQSPLTKTVAYSNTGGYAGTALKLAGLDGVVLSGEASAPRYLYVKGNQVTLLDATNLWGKKATETMSALRQKHGDVRVLSIGPAGENLVRFANVVNDAGRASGVRHGVGSVMGKKKIKAIVIQSDYSLRLAIADRAALRDLLNLLNRKIRESPLLNRDTGSFSVYGTPLAVGPLNSNEALPVRNYSFTHSDNAFRLDGKTMSSTVLVNRLTCNSCAVQCRRETSSVSKYKDFRVEGPDYAQISSLGSNCGVEDLEAVAYMNYLCYELGLDPIEVGNILANYAAISEKGRLPVGFGALNWGDEKRMIELIEMIAYRRLEGSQLAEGADSFIESCQAWDASTTVKGITIQNADPRVEPAWGLLNSTENSGGSIHIWVYPDLIYSFQSLPGIKSLLPSDETDYAAISKSVIYKQNLVAALDSMQICAFSNMAFGIRDYVNVINAVTGWNWSEDNLLEAGQRIFNMERSFDNYVGVHDDALPEKFLNSPISEGKNAGKVCHLEPMLKEYYAARGWNGGMAGS